jgi:hypothetical protein
VLARSLSHPPSIALGHATAGRTLVLVRDRQSCERAGARTVALAEKFDLPYFRWCGRYLMGWAKAQRLTLSEGLASMEEAFPHIGNEQQYKSFGAALAELGFDAGRVTDALALVDRAVNAGEGAARGLCVAEISGKRVPRIKRRSDSFSPTLSSASDGLSQQEILQQKLPSRPASDPPQTWQVMSRSAVSGSVSTSATSG